MHSKMAKRKPTKISKSQKPSAHIKASLTYVAPHAHTGRRLTHKHTSHGLVLIFLIVAGIILFLSLATLEASGVSRNGQINLTAVVPSTPPLKGAVIKTPSKQSNVQQPLTTVTGTCPSGNMTAIYNNGVFTGSTICSSDETFQTVVQLNQGLNTLQAQNYDALNQAGPATDQITIKFEPARLPALPVLNTPADITIDPTIPQSSAPQPSERPCYDEPGSPTGSSSLNLLVSCITRNIFTGELLELPVTLQGGIGPYALSIDWGDATGDQLYSFSQSGSQILSHTYRLPKVKNISLRLADADGATY